MIFLFFVGYVFVFIDKTMMGFALLPIEREFNLPAEQLGYITGMFFLAYSLFQIPAGWLNDRIGFKKVICSSLFLLGGFALCFGWLGAGLATLVLFRFLSGIGHAGYPCSCAKAVVANFELEKRTFVQSILLSSSGLAMTIGPFLAVYCLAHVGWRGSFSLLGISALLIGICILVLVPNPEKPAAMQDKANKISYKSLLASPVVLLMFIASFCINIPAYGLMAWLPKFLVQQRGMPLEESSIVVAAGGLGIWLSSVGAGWVVGRYLQGREPLFIFVNSLLSALCIWSVFTSNTTLNASLFLFLSYIFLMAAFVTVFTLPMKRLPAEVMGAAIGLVNTGGTLGGFVAPITIGYLIAMSQGYLTTFVFLALAMVVAGLSVLPLVRRSSAA